MGGGEASDGCTGPSLDQPIKWPYPAAMQQTWRVSLVGRAFGIVVLVLAGIVASAIIVSGLDLATKIVSVAIIVGFAAYAYVNALRPSITLTNSELVIRNKFKTYRIDLNTIARVDAGYYGIGVQTSHGQVVHGWAVQKSNSPDGLAGGPARISSSRRSRRRSRPQMRVISHENIQPPMTECDTAQGRRSGQFLASFEGNDAGVPLSASAEESAPASRR